MIRNDDAKDAAQERVEIAIQGCMRTLAADGKLTVQFSNAERGLEGEVASLPLPEPLPPGDALSAHVRKTDWL